MFVIEPETDAWLSEPLPCWYCGDVVVSRYCAGLGDPYCTTDCESAAWVADATAVLRAALEVE